MPPRSPSSLLAAPSITWPCYDSPHCATATWLEELPPVVTLASPKSRILACPRSVTKIFAGFIVRHGVYARCTGQLPGAVIGRQDSPAHGSEKSWVGLRIVGWIAGWKFWLCATKSFEMWWPGTEFNRRRQPFQTGFTTTQQVLGGCIPY